MRKSIHSPEYQAVLEMLVAMRKKAGLTHRELAARLNREHSFVGRIETGERRLDIVEFHWVCNALGRKAEEVYTELIRQFVAPHRDQADSAQQLSKIVEGSNRRRVSPKRRPT